MSWGEILEKDIQLIQEWPDASGGDDHGRGAAAENAHTPLQHQKAAEYHQGKADAAQKRMNSTSFPSKQDQAIKTAHEKAAADHIHASKNIQKPGSGGMMGTPTSRAQASSMEAHNADRGRETASSSSFRGPF